MMIESMAGKAAAMHGHAYDATPFSFSEDNTAIEHFGELLTRGAHAGGRRVQARLRITVWM